MFGCSSSILSTNVSMTSSSSLFAGRCSDSDTAPPLTDNAASAAVIYPSPCYPDPDSNKQGFEGRRCSPLRVGSTRCQHLILHLDHPLVEAVRFGWLLVGAAFDDASIFQHQDLVHPLHVYETVCIASVARPGVDAEISSRSSCS